MESIKKVIKVLDCKTDISLFIVWYLTQVAETVDLEEYKKDEVVTYDMLSSLAVKYINKPWKTIESTIIKNIDTMSDSDEDYEFRLVDILEFTGMINEILKEKPNESM